MKTAMAKVYGASSESAIFRRHLSRLHHGEPPLLRSHAAVTLAKNIDE
jgi:hypothetical protein